MPEEITIPSTVTVGNTTVQISNEDKNILLKDQANIDKAQKDINDHKNAYDHHRTQYDYWNSYSCGNRTIGHYQEYDSCMYTRSLNLGQEEQARNNEEALWQNAIVALDEYVKKFNADLKSIQDKVKLQIQAQQANTSAIVTANQNSPAAIINQQNVQIKTAEINAQKEKDKQKNLVFGAIVVVGFIIAVFLIKRLA